MIEQLKKSGNSKRFNEASLAELEASQTIVKLCQWQDTEAEVDAMWSLVRHQQQQRSVWHAVDHTTAQVLASVAYVFCIFYVLSNHADSAFLELRALLEPFGITRYSSNGWGASERHLQSILRRLSANTSPDAPKLSD